MSRKAMNLAQKAIEAHNSGDWDTASELFDEALPALREALAEQPALRVVDCHATGVCVQSGLRAEQPAQPQQKPCDMGNLCIGCSPKNADGSCPGEEPNGACDCYNTGFNNGMRELELPPQRQPPTDEQYREIANQVIATLEDRNGVIDLSFEQELVEEIMLDVTDTLKTAFEAAHGIKEQP